MNITYIKHKITILILAMLFCLSPAQAQQRTYVSNYIKRTVFIEIVCDGVRKGWGSGTEIGRGRILTAAHVVDTKCDVVIKGKVMKVLGMNKKLDVAYLESNRKVPRIALRRPYLGEKITCVGYSKMYFRKYTPTVSVTYGNISTIGLPGGLMRISNQVNSGHSGGGCFSQDDGSLVGVVVSLHSDGHGTPITGYQYLRPPTKKE